MENSNKEILTPLQAKELLMMSIPTLDKLVRNGVFRKYRLRHSNRVYYKKSELLEALKDGSETDLNQTESKGAQKILELLDKNRNK